SCSHWLPDGSLSVLVGRHGAMNPAGRARIRNIMRIAKDYSWVSQPFSLRVSRFGILSGCLEVSPSSRGCFIPKLEAPAIPGLSLSLCGSQPSAKRSYGAGRPLRTAGACPLRHLQETIPYLPPKQPAALRPRLL